MNTNILSFSFFLIGFASAQGKRPRARHLEELKSKQEIERTEDDKDVIEMTAI